MPKAPKNTETTEGSTLSEDEVAAYLLAHPEFLSQHPEVLEKQVPPAQQSGDKISDFQYFAIQKLQNQIQDVRQNFEVLIDSARDNSSVQQQVQRAIVGLIRARGLERLLEVVTIDLMQLFNLDVVRLAMESEMEDPYAAHYAEDNYSGIVFMTPGVAEEIFGAGDVALVSNVEDAYLPGFDEIFVECTRLVKSCALLRLRLVDERRDAILAFGVREAGRFHPRQAVDLLQFLAIIVQERLESCLKEMAPDLPEA